MAILDVMLNIERRSMQSRVLSCWRSQKMSPPITSSRGPKGIRRG